MKYKFGVIILLSVCFVLNGCGTNSGKNKSNKVNIADTGQAVSIQEITKEQRFDNGYLSIGFEGLKEYTEFDNERYDEKPDKGKVYLVLFLGFRNYGDSEYYFNEGYFSSEVDGKNCDHTVLFNEPEGFTTAFANYDSNTEETGFVVWEVDKDWEKLEITYDGLKDVEGNVIQMKFTKEDLQDPVQRAE